MARDMRLVFQPIHDAAASRTIGFEALARWNSPSRGPVRPDVFIAAAERSDLISRLTEALLPQALAAAAAWPAGLSVSFNLSTRDLASPDVMRRIGALIAGSGVAPSRINFEVTETALMRDFDQAREALLALKRLGVGISLDDFGTGYSSLNYVRRLPIDRIKIDRSFITDIEADGGSRSIVKTVVDLCGNLGLECVVEGVETTVQARILRELGCCVMQGYLFGRPMDGSAAARHAAQGLREAAPEVA
jgi:predicted signal transduction protein with EAL and GGDEF domain